MCVKKRLEHTTAKRPRAQHARSISICTGNPSRAEKLISFGKATRGARHTSCTTSSALRPPHTCVRLFFGMHVDDAKPSLPFFVFCPVAPILLDGCALLKLSMVCPIAYECARNLSTRLQATRREILQVAKYLDLAPLRFPGFGHTDVMRLHKISFNDNSTWQSGEDPYLSIWTPAQQVHKGMTPLKAFRYMNQHLQGGMVFEWVMGVLAEGETQFLCPTAASQFESTKNPWCSGAPAIVITMRHKTMPVTITLHYTAPLYLNQWHWPRRRALTP